MDDTKGKKDCAILETNIPDATSSHVEEFLLHLSKCNFPFYGKHIFFAKVSSDKLPCTYFRQCKIYPLLQAYQEKPISPREENANGEAIKDTTTNGDNFTDSSQTSSADIVQSKEVATDLEHPNKSAEQPIDSSEAGEPSTVQSKEAATDIEQFLDPSRAMDTSNDGDHSIVQSKEAAKQLVDPTKETTLQPIDSIKETTREATTTTNLIIANSGIGITISQGTKPVLDIPWERINKISYRNEIFNIKYETKVS